jgi:hypothetical protein
VRWLIAFIIIALFVFFYWPRPDPIPAEETFIGEPIKKLNQAKAFEDEYLKATEAHKAEMEKQLEEASGGG